MNTQMLDRSERRISEPVLFQIGQDRLREYLAEAEYESLLCQARPRWSLSADAIFAVRRTLGVMLIQVGQRLQGTLHSEPAAGPIA